MNAIMKITRNILTLALLSVGLSYAGVYEKQVVTPAPVCGPWYMSLFGGGSFPGDATFTGTGVTANLGFDNGWIAGGAIGVRTANDWRFELELNHSQVPGDIGAVTGLGAGFLGGDVETNSLMLNVAKEFPSLALWNLRPYLGAGVGLSNVRTQLLFENLGAVDAFEGDDIVLGYQAMAGLVLDLTECLQVYAEYRITGHGNSEDVLEDNFLTVGSLDTDWTQHAILGVRWFF